MARGQSTRTPSSSGDSCSQSVWVSIVNDIKAFDGTPVLAANDDSLQREPDVVKGSVLRHEEGKKTSVKET